MNMNNDYVCLDELMVRKFMDSFYSNNSKSSDFKKEADPCLCKTSCDIIEVNKSDECLTKDIVKVVSASASHENQEIAGMILQAKLKVLASSKVEFKETGLIPVFEDTEIKPCFGENPIEGTLYTNYCSAFSKEKSIGSGVGILMLKKDNETYLFYHLFSSKDETDDEFLDRMENAMMEVYNTCYSSYTIVDTFFASECLDIEPGKTSITSCGFVIC